MEGLEELAGHLSAARTELRAMHRRARTCLQVITDLEQRLDGLLAAQSTKEDTANEYRNGKHPVG